MIAKTERETNYNIEICQTNQGSIAVLCLSGTVDNSNVNQLKSDAYWCLRQPEIAYLVIDITNCDSIGTSATAIMLGIYKKWQKRIGESVSVVYEGDNEGIDHIIETARIGDMIPFYRKRDLAILSAKTQLITE